MAAVRAWPSWSFPLLALLAGLAAMLFSLTHPAFVTDWVQRFGLLGLFFASLAANATLFLPLPLDVVVFALGSSGELLASGPLAPFLIAVAAGTGAAAGEMTAYAGGFLGAKGVERWKSEHHRRLQEVKARLRDTGMLYAFLGALTPFPFDLVGLAAGLIRYDLPRFFVAAVLGKIVRYGLLVYAGRFSLELVRLVFGV